MTDEDLWKYVNERKQHCQNHCDSTLLIYAAIEGARLNYNKSIETYESICDEYYDMNEMLLRHDDKLAQKLNILKGYINKCEELFAEYKRLTKLYPIANYKQLYEKAPIETFRLEGLTNSDFFNNRFTIWDYSAWIDNLEKTLNSHIIPLRKEVDKINGGLCGIRVPEGLCEITFKYRTPGLTLGIFCTIAGIVFLALYIVIFRVIRREKPLPCAHLYAVERIDGVKAHKSYVDEISHRHSDDENTEE